MSYDPRKILFDHGLWLKKHNHKQKVLIVGPASPSTGGISSYLDDLLSSKLRDQFLLGLFDPLAVKKRFKKQESHFSLKEVKASLRVLRTFIKAIREFDPAMVHIHTSSHWGFYEKAIIMLIAKFIFKKKTILHIHGGEFGIFYKKAIPKNLMNWLIKEVNKTLIVSKMIKEELGLSKLILVDNCDRFESKVLSVDKLLLRQKYDIPKRKTVFLSAALLQRIKGIGDTLIAFRDIYKRREDFYFIIAGEGPEKDNIIDFVESNNLYKNVKVMDFITDREKDDIFMLADVFILQSTVESFGISLVEAISHGLFVITTPVGIASDAENVFNDRNCIRVPIKSTKKLQKAILKVLDKKVDIEKVMAKNFYDFKARFDVGPVFENMKMIYEEVLNSN